MPAQTSNVPPGERSRIISSIIRRGSRVPPNASTHNTVRAAWSGRGSRWNAGVTVGVRHSNGDPVLTATVSGSWSEGANGSASCDTDATGQCELVKQNVKSNVASVKLSITGVTHPSLTYDESENPPEIGNTPVITVSKPQ